MTQDRQTLFQTRWLSVHRIGDWDFVERPNADCCVGVLAITPGDEIVHLVPRAELRARFEQWERDGFAIDFKIHAALWAAGL